MSDSYDRRVLTTYLEEYLGDFLFDTFQPFHFYTAKDGSTIDVPPAGPRDVYMKAIEALPLVQTPEVRGQAQLLAICTLCVQHPCKAAGIPCAVCRACWP